MRYISLCSGIEAATVAWEPLGWKPVFFAEIDKFPSEVLSYHYPDIPNLGDISKIKGADLHEQADVIIGGTPCQDFSIAGKRKGLEGERSGLAREFIRLVDEIKPQWFVWENVPGALSTHNGRDVYEFFNALEKCGYSIAWRILDAQHFGVPQRRRRLFVVGYLGDDWRTPAAVLFESESLRRDTQKSRKSEEEIARCLTSSAQCYDCSVETFVMQAYSPPVSATLCASGAGTSRPAGQGNELDYCIVNPPRIVRRLTPVECERLQGFPDNYTKITGASDTARYKALGNSMAVPVIRWLGERIDMVANKQTERNPVGEIE